MRRPQRLRLIVLISLTVGLVSIASLAQAALPSTSPDDTAMLDGAGARVRTIAETPGGRIWVGGDFTEVDNQSGSSQRSVSALAAFTPSGLLDTAVSIPEVTRAGGGAIVYDLALSPTGVLYLAGNFDQVGGQPRQNVAAIDPNTGAVLPFSPNVATASTVFATSSTIYVGTGKILSFQPSGTKTPGFNEPQAFVNAGLRGHVILPQFREIAMVGNTLVVACQCDSVTDANGTVQTKAAVKVDATTGALRPWTPANLGANSAAFGISVVVRNDVAYLGAGGSDFTAAYDLATGAQRWKTDTSGSSQVVAWYQGQLIVGGHFDWTGSPTSNVCGDNASPNTACYHTPKLTAMNPSTGAVLLTAPNTPWNPGVCCKYNGIWALTPGADGKTLHVGGEFTKIGGTWSGSGTNWTLSGADTQKYYARLGGPSPSTQELTLVKAGTGTGAVTSAPSGISCAAACSTASKDYPVGQTVTLTATPSAGYTFTGWTGDCTNASGTCTVAMNARRSVGATFAPISFQLSVAKNGSGTGTVTSSPAGVNCGATCAPFFPQNTVVTLTATPGPNSAFSGWSGSGCTGTSTCTVTMDSAKSVTAAFSSTTATLTITKTTGVYGGSGSVTSSPTGITCGSTCSAQFSAGTVTLTAKAATGSVFNGWNGGGCAGTDLTCVVTMDASKTVNADFEDARNLTVTSVGTGTGVVASAPAGITCPGTCAKPFARGSTVTLTATPDTGSLFSGWSGTAATANGCTTATTCNVLMDGGLSITATFAPAQTLTVSRDGTGAGSVVSNPAGIDCGLTCVQGFAPNTVVTLTAAGDANSTFTRWTGSGCSGTGTCVVTMSTARSVTAAFTLVQRPLGVSVAGQGTVTDTPGPISCPGVCAASYEHGTDVQLVATPAANWAFTGWTGECSGTDICIVSMTASRSVTATFGQINRTLTVIRAGSGSGTVSSNPAGIACPSDCAANYSQGTVVTMEQVADMGSVFTGWSGDCTGTGSCVVTIDAAKNVTATFTASSSGTVTLQQDDPAVSFNGWRGVVEPTANGGASRVSNVKNDKITWKSASGTSLTWVARTGPDMGKATVVIDGTNKGTVDLYSAAPGSNSTVYSGLTNQVHTVIIKVLGTKSAASTGTGASLDAFVQGTTTTQESNLKVKYDTWTGVANTKASGGTFHKATAATANVTVSFTGTAIDWVTTKGPAYGKASVVIDGVPKGTIDLYQASTLWRSPVTFGGLASGPHTMVIQVLGQKNASATSTQVVIDAFVVSP